eukprot:TRINITY_DN12392_c0_g2_i1.p1 TRINITY_DN12392_c0_g2~~TRINITY_DN12392_c0_g2_i1.p1  ORF type:complete len:194 (-),score=31.37 TRINITY_DN12392_c0_g2_i1:121-702(-)
MACGFGMAAVRTLSRKVQAPRSRGSLSKQQGIQSDASMDKDEDGIVFEDEDAEQPCFNLRSTTCGSAYSDARLLEGDVYRDNAKEESDDEDVSSDRSAPMQAASRAITLSCDREFPDPSAYIDPEWIENYTKLYLSDGDGLEDAEHEYAEESDTDEMYSGPLQPCRTTARRDFPHPSSYLSREEFADLWNSYS